MSSFVRRFLEDPGNDVLLEIESIDILDLDPPATISGVGAGTACVFAEFEDGDFEVVTEVTSADDLKRGFGGFGFSYAGVVACNPCARARKADGATAFEYWNGNGIVQLTGKKFKRLLVCRVDTSIGSVAFTRQASVTGAAKFTYSLASGDTLTFELDGGGPATATFTGAAAVVTGSGGTFAIVGGESVTLGYDAAPNFTVVFLSTDTTVGACVSRINSYAGFTFASVSGGQIRLTGRVAGTNGQVRVTAFDAPTTATKLGLTTGATAGTMSSTSSAFPVALQPGDAFTGAVDGGAPATLTIAATPSTFTGNGGGGFAAVAAADHLDVLVAGIPGTQVISFAGTENTEALYLAAINAQLTGGAALDDGAGQIILRADRKGTGSLITVLGSSSASVLAVGVLDYTPGAGAGQGGNVVDVLAVTAVEFAGLLTATFAGSVATAVGNGVTWTSSTTGPASSVQLTGTVLAVAKIVGFDLALHPGAAAVVPVNGTGNVGDVGRVTFPELKSIVEAAVAGTLVEQLADGRPRVSNVATPATGTIEVEAPSTATDFGFTVGDVGNAASGGDGSVPAGTVVQTVGGLKFVTMQTVVVSGASAGPYTVKIRHALDDGTGLGTGAGTIVQVGNETPLELDSFAVINLVPATAALSEVAVDLKYQDAIDSSVDVNGVAKEINVVWSARQSDLVRRGLKANVLDASANGCFGRMACVRPPLGTLKTVAQSSTAEPGVGAYRNQRVIYNYPGLRTLVPGIAVRGLAGGAGFTADGKVDVGADGFCSSVISQLAPEEDIGQQTTFMDGALGLESSPNVAGFNINDYKSFKRNGICAPRFSNGAASFQSAVTSVDPFADPGLVPISRRRMGDFVQDSLSLRLVNFGKKLSTDKRRVAIVSEIRAFMKGLLGAAGGTANGGPQRIAGFSVSLKGNTPETLGLGIYRIKLKVRTLASLKAIVLETVVGDTVDVIDAEAA